jgi:hypothetical protein
VSAFAITTQQKLLSAFTFVALLFLWASYAHHFDPPIFPLDDGYIYLHNAQVLHQGFDRNFPGVPALDGSTSPIYLLLVTILLFVFSPLWALQTAAWLGILLYALGLLRLAFAQQASILQAILFLILGLTFAFVPLQLLNGVETGWAMAGMVWLLALVSETETTGKRIARNILCGTLPFLRPELLIFSGLFLAWQGWCYWHQTQILSVVWRKLLIDILWVLLACAPWVMWYWSSTGLPYPETIGAKQAFFAENHWTFSLKWQHFTRDLFAFFAVLGNFNFLGMLILLSLTPLGRIGLVFIVFLLAGYCLVMPDAVACNSQRYVYILIPILLFGVISVIKYSVEWIHWSANCLLVIAVAWSLFYLPNNWNFYVEQSRAMTSGLIETAHWCRAHLPVNSKVLVHDAGYISFATPLHLIDMVGLKTPSNIRFHQALTLPSGGAHRIEAIAAIIRYSHAQYWVVLPEYESYFGLIHDVEKFGWRLQLLRPVVDGKYNYRVYRIEKQV